MFYICTHRLLTMIHNPFNQAPHSVSALTQRVLTIGSSHLYSMPALCIHDEVLTSRASTQQVPYTGQQCHYHKIRFVSGRTFLIVDPILHLTFAFARRCGKALYAKTTSRSAHSNFFPIEVRARKNNDHLLFLRI